MEQVIANGLYLGAQYALIALGLTLIFAPDERPELRPRADVRARRLRHLYDLRPARAALRRRRCSPPA